ncbi:flippase [Marinifilum sp. D714]|uniref:flippase n=1 Tax=Marinifilum sp. D714 TaxID=2937523 RepID=UPI0027CDF51D|nr:flippase [Marinifilum sp. D714]MDQ2179824.1 flippase [Marinifilum sp. D714]
MFSTIIGKVYALSRNESFLKYFSNTGWLMLDKVIRLFLGVFVGVWVARYLGPDDFGILNYAISFVALFGAFSKLGLDNIIVRNLVQDNSKRDLVLGTSLVMRLLGALVLLLLVYNILQFSSSTPFEKLIVIVIAFGQFFLSFEVVDFYFQSQVKGKFSTIVNTFSLIIFSITRILLIVCGASIEFFAVAVVLESIIKALLFMIIYQKEVSLVRYWKFNFDIARRLLKDSWPLILANIVIMIYMRIDQLMIKEMLNNSANGEYSAAVRLSEAWYFIPMVIANSLFPAIIKAKSISLRLYHDRLTNLYQFMFILSLVVVIPVLFMSDWVVNALYGKEYVETSKVLIIHIWTSVFVFIGVVNSKYLINENLQFYLTLSTCVGAIINVCLNYILIKNIGIVGAAFSTLISQFIASYFSFILFKRTRRSFFLITRSVLSVYKMKLNFKKL